MTWEGFESRNSTFTFQISTNYLILPIDDVIKAK